MNLRRTIGQSACSPSPTRCGTASDRRHSRGGAGPPQAARRAGLKWSSDLLVDERNVAGILCESRCQGDTLQWLGVAIGVNVANDIPVELTERAVALRELRPVVRRIDVLDLLVPALLRLAAHGGQLTEFEC